MSREDYAPSWLLKKNNTHHFYFRRSFKRKGDGDFCIVNHLPAIQCPRFVGVSVAIFCSHISDTYKSKVINKLKQDKETGYLSTWEIRGRMLGVLLYSARELLSYNFLCLKLDFLLCF